MSPIRPAYSGDLCLNCYGYFVFDGREFDREEKKCYNVFKCGQCGRVDKYATALDDCPQAFIE